MDLNDVYFPGFNLKNIEPIVKRGKTCNGINVEYAGAVPKSVQNVVLILWGMVEGISM